MDDKIDFYNDINKFSKNIIKICDLNIKLDLQIYDDINVVDLILKWKSCFEFLGRQTAFLSRKVQKIIYCLLTDYTIINFVNKEVTNLSLYNVITQSFFGFDVINDTNRIIKIKLFNVCNEMVIMDCNKYPTYKIYHLHNLNIIKEFYKTSKINFDTIKKDICIIPIFVGNINNLRNDFKKLSINNFNISLKKNIIHTKNYLTRTKELNDEISKVQNELFNIYKQKIMLKLKL